MSKIKEVSTSTLREAALAWRRNDVVVEQHRNASGWLKWFITKPDMRLHDIINDLIEEIERLRKSK